MSVTFLFTGQVLANPRAGRPSRVYGVIDQPSLKRRANDPLSVASLAQRRKLVGSHHSALGIPATFPPSTFASPHIRWAGVLVALLLAQFSFMSIVSCSELRLLFSMSKHIQNYRPPQGLDYVKAFGYICSSCSDPARVFPRNRDIKITYRTVPNFGILDFAYAHLAGTIFSMVIFMMQDNHVSENCLLENCLINQIFLTCCYCFP